VGQSVRSPRRARSPRRHPGRRGFGAAGRPGKPSVSNQPANRAAADNKPRRVTAGTISSGSPALAPAPPAPVRRRPGYGRSGSWRPPARTARQPPGHDSPREFLRGKPRDLRREREDESLLNAASPNNSTRRSVDVIRGGRRSGATTCAGCGSKVSADAFQPRAFASAVNRSRMRGGRRAPVEIADGERAGTEIGGRFIEASVDPHGITARLHQNFQPVVGQADVGREQALRARVRRSWQRCVKKARRGARASTVFTERSTVECVGCGCSAAHPGTARPGRATAPWRLRGCRCDR